MKREFLMLAHGFKNQSIGGWFVSEKLDGMRAFWDGGVSRDKFCSEVPWANTQKDHIKKNPPVATGLWSRGGKVIHAPDWFLNNLPNHPADGELYAGPGLFQQVMTIVKGDRPDERWRDIRFCCFGLPAYTTVFADGIIDKINVTLLGAYKGLDEAPQKLLQQVIDHEEDNECFYWLMQEKLPMSQEDALDRINERMDYVLQHKGEGLMLANPHARWEPCRSHNLLKVKRFQDDEGTVLGYIWGKHTDKGSKLKGLMGAILVKYNDKIFELSGFTNEERKLVFINGDDAKAMETDGGDVTDKIFNPKFLRGSMIRFKYRELTDAGIPKEARYFR